MDAPSLQPARARDPLIDNARFLLIVLVVVGHLVRPAIEGPGPLRALYIVIYTFHMPMFVLLSGFLSKRVARTWRDHATLAVRLLLPYLLFQFAWSLVAWMTTDRFRFLPHRPAYMLWFLLALYVWRATLPLVRRWPGALPLAIVAGAAGALHPAVGTTFTLGRILAFWPFFLVGTMLDRAFFTERLPSLRRVAAPVFVAGAVLLALFGDAIRRGWLLAADPYAQQGLQGAEGPAVRVLFWVVAAVMGLSFLALSPSSRTWFTHLGARTLTVYLLHGFLVRGLEYAGFYEYVDTGPERALLVLGAACVPLLLAWRPLHQAVTAVTQPRFLLDRLSPPERHLTGAHRLGNPMSHRDS